MKLSVTNLGAIKEATVEIGGLTVFVGQNGTGKSYLAKVIYGLQRHETLQINFPNNAERFYQIIFNKAIGTPEEAIADIKKLRLDALKLSIPKLINLHAESFKDILALYFNDDSNLFLNTTLNLTEIELLSYEHLQAILNDTITQLNNLQQSQTNLTLIEVLWPLCWYIFWGMRGGLADYFPLHALILC